MGLIAAKPVKPCDGGVFGGFDLLLKKERKASEPVPGRACVALCGQSVNSEPAFHPAASGFLQLFSWLSPQPPAPLRGIAGFAMDLIAAKPVKPCDGGVFGGFDLLLKKEQKALVPVSGRAGAPFAAQARAGLRACLKSGSICKRPFPLLPQQPAPLQGIAVLLLL